MRDLQHRLVSLGIALEDEPGRYGESTAEAVRKFQDGRGLRADGVCGAMTWNELVEAGYRLGGRGLYLTEPMLRGDDVADLQRRLGTLGFDAGRIDGIFGPNTERALVDFQRNAGVVVDGICGPSTVSALARLGRCEDLDLVVGVREREALRRGPRSLAGQTVAVGDSGGLDALAGALRRALREAGAQVVICQHPDGSAQAAQANAAEADVYFTFAVASEGECCRAIFYRGHGWESPAGRRLAELTQEEARAVLGFAGEVRGMSLPILRETRMPAVLCELAPASTVVRNSGALAAAVARGLARWSQGDGD